MQFPGTLLGNKYSRVYIALWQLLRVLEHQLAGQIKIKLSGSCHHRIDLIPSLFFPSVYVKLPFFSQHSGFLYMCGAASPGNCFWLASSPMSEILCFQPPPCVGISKVPTGLKRLRTLVLQYKYMWSVYPTTTRVSNIWHTQDFNPACKQVGSFCLGSPRCNWLLFPLPALSRHSMSMCVSPFLTGFILLGSASLLPALPC